jgi:hypothetical protein
MLYNKQNILLENVPAFIFARISDIDMILASASKTDVYSNYAKLQLSNDDD